MKKVFSSIPVPEARAGESRFYALNALRAWGILLVVLGHAGIPFMTTKMPDLLWAVRDPSTHLFFDWFCWAMQFLAMPFFFLSAGFFSAKKFEILGAYAFIVDRTKRILVPFLVSMVVILPLVYYAWSCGWYLSGRCTLREIILAKFLDPEIRRNLVGPAHLWFLEYLFLISLAYTLFGRWKLSGRLEKTLMAFPLLFAVPTIAILQINYDAGINYHNTFLLHPFRFLHYGYYFIVGTLARRLPHFLKTFEVKGPLILLVSVPSLVAVCFLLKRYFSEGLAPVDRFTLSVVTAFFTWSVLLGGIGLALRYLKRQNAVVRYLSDASFPIYLLHMPVVGLIQCALYRFALPAGFKFLIAFCGTLFVTLFLYRTTRVPDYLSGLRRVGSFSRAQKITLSFTLAILIFVVGATYQFLYNREKARYTEVISGYYRKYFDREPDRAGVNHWAIMALNKLGLEEVEKIVFIEGAGKRIVK